jgi:hypothetical protein
VCDGALCAWSWTTRENEAATKCRPGGGWRRIFGGLLARRDAARGKPRDNIGVVGDTNGRQPFRSFTVAGASAMSSARIDDPRRISPMRTTFAFAERRYMKRPAMNAIMRMDPNMV